MKEVISFPTGYPYILYKVKDSYVAACNESEAIAQVKDGERGRVSTVNVLDLIKNVGHAETTKLLKRFGDEWMTKDGKAFFKAKIT